MDGKKTHLHLQRLNQHELVEKSLLNHHSLDKDKDILDVFIHDIPISQSSF